MKKIEYPSCNVRLKNQKRTADEVKDLKNRLNRIVGQIQGIEKMIESQRYCGDVLIQIGAVEKAMKSVGMRVLREHMQTCVSEQIKAGNQEIVDETIELMKRL